MNPTLVVLVASCCLYEAQSNFQAKSISDDFLTESSSMNAFQGECFGEMPLYFGNLTSSFLVNQGDNCVFVSLNMILSFYDTYYNDDIINDGYERPATSSLAIDQTGNLLGIAPGPCGSPGAGFGFDEDYVRPGQAIHTEGTTMLSDVSSDKVSIGWGVITGLSSWGLSDTFGYTMLNDAGDIYDWLDVGVPVMAEFGGADSHCVVLFDYDQNGNFLYHNGYVVGNSMGYPTFGVINPSELGLKAVVFPSAPLAHVCSNNYLDSLGNPICPCSYGFVGIYSDENHIHTDVYFDESSHYSTCPSTSQSYKVMHNHVEIVDPVGYTYHELECSCGDQMIVLHSPSSYEYVGYEGHLIHFDDGCVLLEEHEIIGAIPYGRDIHMVLCSCGSLGYQHHFVWVEFYYNDYPIPFWMCPCGFSNCPFESQEEADWYYNYFLNAPMGD